MKELNAKIIFVLIDTFVIFLSIVFAYMLRYILSDFFSGIDSYSLLNYITFYPLYFITFILLVYEGIYTHRYDFWHESRLIIKSLLLSFILILAYLAMTKSTQDFSRAVLSFSFLFMIFLIPLVKNITKKMLYKKGIWRRTAYIYGDNPFLKEEVFSNHYLGYIDAHNNEAKTIFINSKAEDISQFGNIINQEMKKSHEVIFIPLVDEYDLTRSHIYQLSNTRTNLIAFQNRLKSTYRQVIKNASDVVMALISFPLITPIMLIIAYKIKRDNPNEKILFKQKRLGKNGKAFTCYKFQTMHENSDALLQNYLQSHPEELAYYEIYHKYKNDPRVTKVGHFLRRTSLDELPQIFNVFRGDMSFIGPRPYMLNEEEKIGEELDTILAVKPGITGLWQVSGRSDVDFYSRVKLDVWYIRNWNLWMDLVILIKTIKTVLIKEGAS